MEDYNWEVIHPAGAEPEGDTYWDPDFVADVQGQGSNVSYASIPMAGERKNKQWRDSLDAEFAAIGNRGVEHGEFVDEEIYESSLTLQIHGGSKQWVGNICFNDNHVQVLNTFLPLGLGIARLVRKRRARS